MHDDHREIGLTDHLSIILSNGQYKGGVQLNLTVTDDVEFDTDPPKEKGFFGGLVIPIAIVGGLAVVGGAVTLLRRGRKPKGDKPDQDSDGERKEEQPSAFQMVLWKDFGDTLYIEGEAQTVGARIVEVKPKGGGVANRDDLTRRISFDVSDNIGGENPGMRGMYMCLDVRASGKTAAPDERGIVTIKFTGDGSTYTNNVRFKIAELKKPRIVFPALTDDGQGWIENADLSTVDMVAGAGGTDRVRFVFVDTKEEPTDIRFLNHDGFDVTYEKDAHPLAYWAVIVNRTSPAEKDGGVFSDMRDCTFTVEGEFANGYTASANFGVYLYPQGLSVLKDSGPNKLTTAVGVEPKLKDGWLQVVSYLTREKGSYTLDPVIRPTGFDLCYATLQANGTASVEMDGGPFKFGELKPTDESTTNILAKYRYEVGSYSPGYAMRPNDSIPGMGEVFHVYLPVTAGGESIDVPMNLVGEPFDPIKDWKAEYQGLQDVVWRYFPEDVAPTYIEHVKQNYSDPNVFSLNDLRTVRGDLIRAAQAYWIDQRDSQLGLVKYYDATEWIFKKPARFVGDVAFRIVVRFYCGEAENWITPAKDLVIDSVDDAIWSFAYTGKAEWNVVEHALEQATNAFENYISVTDGVTFTISTKAKEVPKLVIALFGFLIADCVQNYYKMNPRDFYDALQKTFFDTSIMAVKKIVGAGLQKAMNSEAVKQFFKNDFIGFLNCCIPGVAKANLTLTDPKTGGKLVDSVTGQVQKTSRVIIDNWDYKPMWGDGAQRVIQIGADKTVMPGAFVTLEEARNWLAPTGLGSELFQSLEIVGDQVLSYRAVVQWALDKLFTDGVAKIGEWTEIDDGGMIIHIPVMWGSGDYEYITINVGKLLTSPVAIASKAFEYLYNQLFGWFEIPSDKPSDDPGREALKG